MACHDLRGARQGSSVLDVDGFEYIIGISGIGAILLAMRIP